MIAAALTDEPDRITTVPDDDAETRFTRLESDVAELREQVTLARSDAAAARLLASGADRDVSEVRAELRAHTRGLNALRETQLEQGRAIADLQHGMSELRQELHQEIGGLRQELHQEIGGLRQELHQEIGGLGQELHQEIGGLRQEMQGGFATMAAGMAQITTLLTEISAPERNEN